jgi:hypothetical protein
MDGIPHRAKGPARNLLFSDYSLTADYFACLAANSTRFL